MKNNKQTSLEWLYDNLVPTPSCEEDMKYNEMIWKKAKRMERSQIEEAFNNSYWFIDGHEYYEKTYQ